MSLPTKHKKSGSKDNKTSLTLKLPRLLNSTEEGIYEDDDDDESELSGEDSQIVEKLRQKKEELKIKKKLLKNENMSKKRKRHKHSSDEDSEEELQEASGTDDEKKNLKLKLTFKNSSKKSSPSKSSVNQEASISYSDDNAAVATNGLLELAKQAERTKYSYKEVKKDVPSTHAKFLDSKNNIAAEIEAAKQDLFTDSKDSKSGLFFCYDKELEDPCEMKSVKVKDEGNDEMDQGYVVDFLPKPKSAPKRQKQTSSGESDDDYDPSKDAYFQDADYVYPRIDVPESIDADDFSWRPNQTRRKKGAKKKSKLNSSESRVENDEFDPFFAPDEKPPQRMLSPTGTCRKVSGEQHDYSSPPKENSNKSFSSDLTWQVGPGRPNTKSVEQSSKQSTSEVTLGSHHQAVKEKLKKKGFSTAKQRLGKILKLDKMGARYVR